MRTHVAGIMLACLLAVLVVPAGGALEQAAPERDKYDAAKAVWARELIRQARTAAGGEQALQSVTSLSATGQLRRFVKYVHIKSPTRVEEREKVLRGKISIEFLLPDKSRIGLSTSTLLGTRYSYTEVINGDRAWRNPPLQAQSSSRNRHVIDVSDFERSLAYQAQDARQKLTLYSLAWLVQGLPRYPVELSHEGWLQTKDGKADVIAVHSANDFQLWFLLNQETRLPLGFVSRFSTSPAEPVLVERTFFFSVSYLRGLQERARQERATQAAKPPKRSEWQLHLSDHRRVAGILLPHRLTMTVDGRRVEELTITRFEVNHGVNPKDFERKPDTGSIPRGR
jgi:hypothetical protein